MSSTKDERRRQELVTLLRRAFAEAAASGKSGTSMTTPVLKNRLLQITDNTFKEADYGQPTLVRLLLGLPGAVRLEGESSPYLVHLLPEQAEAAPPGPRSTPPDGDLRHLRVRDDLWAACIDNVSGARYVWDPKQAHAVVATSSNDRRRRLPTLSKEQLDKARSAFVAETWTAEPGNAWIEKGGSLKTLPPPLRGRWAERLKRLVVDTLLAWFRSKNITPPDDFLIPTSPAPVPLRPAQAPAAESEDLRAWVLKVVAGMTREELAALKLPASAAARAAHQ